MIIVTIIHPEAKSLSDDHECLLTVGNYCNETASSTKLLVAAIDFGTTFSGYAFSFRHEYETDPTKATGKIWQSRTGLLSSMKAPTCLLLKPDKSFAAFGYDAENEYSELALEGEHQKWYYFKRFKMLLHDRMGIKRDIELEDETGKTVSAITVFSLAIKFLKEDLLQNCKDKLADLYEEDIHWVLTTPAIWSDAAKQFMREAAVKAGIRGEALEIALEPEAASIYCRHIPLKKSKQEEKVHVETLNPGSKYLVVDVGGGTVDITAHEVTQNRSIKELHQVSGGPWGGTKVDDEFRQLLMSILGAPVFKKFQEDNMEDYLELFREFELLKRDIKPGANNKQTFRVPASLKEVFETETKEKIQDVINDMNIRGKVKWIKDKMQIEASLMEQFFEKAIREIIKHIESLLQLPKLEFVTTILMVGGFSESAMLQEAVKSKFSNKQVLIPPDAGAAVLKGAVMYGHNPRTILERVCKYTYGVGMSLRFDETIHNEEHRETVDGVDWCNDLFDKHVQIGTTVVVGEPQTKQTYTPMYANQDSVRLCVFASTSSDPTYTTETSCVKLGTLKVSMPILTGDKDREVDVQMFYCGTELEVKAEDKTSGKTFKVLISLLLVHILSKWLKQQHCKREQSSGLRDRIDVGVFDTLYVFLNSLLTAIVREKRMRTLSVDTTNICLAILAVVIRITKVWAFKTSQRVRNIRIHKQVQMAKAETGRQKRGRKKVKTKVLVRTVAASSTKLLVAAIDFGTTFSGYAFSFRHEYETDPAKTTGKIWQSRTGLLSSMKAPTCLLLKPDKSFAAFGYDAENEYSELALEGEHQKWYYFKRFKMLLHDRMGIKRDIELEDETGKTVSAITVFSLAIKFLKDDLLQNCKDKLTEFYEEDIHWVLTTPAIWTDAAKQFMREAAVKAGIRGEALEIALEPEAASIYCRHIPLKKSKQEEKVHVETLNPGSKYLVVDVGGGTVDITAHEVTQNRSIKELHQVSGGPWGGTKVDDEFRQLLMSILGAPVFKKFQEDNMEDYLELLREFELKKRDIKPGANNKQTFRVPASLKEVFETETKEKIQDVINDMNIRGKVKWIKDKMQIEASLMEQFFEKAIREIIKHIESLLQLPKLKSVTTILMVGGFSESAMLQEAVKSKFSNKQIGTTVVVGEPQTKKTYTPMYANQDSVEVGVFASTSSDPTYTTETSCVKLGTLEVGVPVLTGDKNRKVDVQMFYSGTELEVKAEDKTSGKTFKGTFDFLG
ncbi:hypothetical protein ScPMuIL_011298 [Solemya velum]